MSDEITLLPCPFCGGHAHVESVVPETSLGEGRLAAWVICDVCRAQVERNWEDEAIKAWNRRAERATCEQVLVDCDDGLTWPPFTAHCSACGAKWGFITPKYCHNCGKKVRK